jgi:NADPH:quinone reductase-like Zn-dependent oxidoreductase
MIWGHVVPAELALFFHPDLNLSIFMNYLDQLFGRKGKVAIVTGGSRGIGQVVAIGLARAGAEVVIFSRSEARDTVKQFSLKGEKHTAFWWM